MKAAAATPLSPALLSLCGALLSQGCSATPQASLPASWCCTPDLRPPASLWHLWVLFLWEHGWAAGFASVPEGLQDQGWGLDPPCPELWRRAETLGVGSATRRFAL